jgi:hypothetical protein
MRLKLEGFPPKSAAPLECNALHCGAEKRKSLKAKLKPLPPHELSNLLKYIFSLGACARQSIFPAKRPTQVSAFYRLS